MFFLLCCIESLRLKFKDQATENKFLEDKIKHVYSRNVRRSHRTIIYENNDREENKAFTVKERRTDRQVFKSSHFSNLSSIVPAVGRF